jgi:hypothetical protein
MPPLLAADGFESVTTAEVGGARVISTGGPIPPISGARSVYIGAQGAPQLGGAVPGETFRARLAVPAGGRTLRLAYRLVSRFGGSSLQVFVGSVGHKSTSGSLTVPADVGTTPLVLPNAGMVQVTDVLTQEIALPDDVTSEVAVSVSGAGVSCGLPLPPAGALIDDLRIE